MKIQKKWPIILAAAALFAGQSALMAQAGTITSIRVKIDGKTECGAVIEDTMPDVECSSQRYELASYEFTNGCIQWDRQDVPQLALELYPLDDNDFSDKAFKNIKITGNIEGTYHSFEWIDEDDADGRSGGSGAWVYIDLAPVSTPGASALQRKAEIEAQYDGMKSRKKAAAAIASTVVDGWYQNSKGWWYLRADGTYPKDQWETVLGVNCHFNADGYLDTGWFQADGAWYYAGDSGEVLKNTVTPDGYLVDAEGRWVS